jgi:elongator complex protein 3
MKKYLIKEIIKSGNLTRQELEKMKRVAMARYQQEAPTNISLLQFYHEMKDKEKRKLFKEANKVFSEKNNARIKKILTTRPVRSLSGIVNVSVLTKPYPCPGKCIYCPSEKGLPKSYLKEEPAAMRALMNNYDPEKQTRTRIQALKLSGHPIDKIEVRVIGGTWSFYPKKYRESFVKSCFKACNDFNEKNQKRNRSLKQEQKRNEQAKHRIIGLSVETRPDFINEKEIELLRNLGVTSVELGVQSVDDSVLQKIKRGHKVSETIRATRELKNAGFKVCYQMMPNLPGSSLEKDLQGFKELFHNPDFQPDYLKIYPMATIKGTEAYALWRQKKYKPYSDLELKQVLKQIKKQVPRYVRIQRLIRDIPAQKIEAGTKVSNLRQVILDEAKKEGWSCQCIRCREIKEFYNKKEKLVLFREDYQASQGTEIFLSFEDQKRKNIYSLLRLRINPSQKKAIIREIHTYGQQLAIDKKGASPQHKGLGKKLMKKAEQIASKEFSCFKMSVISAVGTRNYYRKLGYRLQETYMTKKL